MENVLREALFSPLGIKNVFQDTKKFNFDSPMGTKKMSTVFQMPFKAQTVTKLF